MRKVDDGEKKKEKKEKKRMLFLVATTSLPAVDRPNADRWNTTRSCQFRNRLTIIPTDGLTDYPKDQQTSRLTDQLTDTPTIWIIKYLYSSVD